MPEILTFTLVGTRDMLQDNGSAMIEPEAEPGAKKPMRSVARISRAEECRRSAYFLADGKSLCFPSGGVRKCLISSAKGLTSEREGSKRKVGLMPIVSGAIMVLDEWFPLVDARDRPLTAYAMDVRRVVPPGQGAIPGVRARIAKGWRLQCAFEFMSPPLSVDQVQSLLEIGGRSIGLGAYRPEKTGFFGTFEVEAGSMKTRRV